MIPTAPYFSRHNGKVQAGPRALVSFLNGYQAPRSPAVRLPAPKVSLDGPRERLGQPVRCGRLYLDQQLAALRRPVEYEPAPPAGEHQRLLRPPDVAVNMVAELGDGFQTDRVCRYCGVPFTPRGRAIFCTPAHAARARHERRKRVRKARERAADKLVESKALSAASVESARRSLRAHRAALRRRQRARAKVAKATSEREVAYTASGGKN